MGSWLTLEGCRCCVSPPCGILAGLSGSSSPEQPVLVTDCQGHPDGELAVSWESLRVGSLCLVSRQSLHYLLLHRLPQKVGSPQQSAKECSGETETPFCLLGIDSSGAAWVGRWAWVGPAALANLGGC